MKETDLSAWLFLPQKKAKELHVTAILLQWSSKIKTQAAASKMVGTGQFIIWKLVALADKMLFNSGCPVHTGSVLISAFSFKQLQAS